MHPSHFTVFPGEAVRPMGWLRNQLEIQAQGLCGQLDTIWPEIGDSRWIGGNRDGWELSPYWLDGFIPLAWMLDRRDMQRRACDYIDDILARQQPDGWISPCTDGDRAEYDVWAVFLLCKVLTQYADYTGDARIESVVFRVLRRLNRHLNSHTLFDWSLSRWQECLIPILWLYERRPEAWLLELARKLRLHGMDWRGLFIRDASLLAAPADVWSYHAHGVNIAMALKADALLSRLDGDRDEANLRTQAAVQALMEAHGTAAGVFSSAECLAGTDPLARMELCAVVEAMYAYEMLLATTGDPLWGDMLERAAYNALPAALDADMWRRCHLQSVNQTAYDTADVPQTHEGAENLSGPPEGLGYDCCTTNFGQGWPKLVRSALMRAEDGIAVTAIAPVQVSTAIEGVPVVCGVETDYPFADGYTVIVRAKAPVTFTLHLRIPGFVDTGEVDGVAVPPGRFYAVRRLWQGESRVQVRLGMCAALVARPSGLYCAMRGPLAYALDLPAEYREYGVAKDGHTAAGFAISTRAAWNYGFADTSLHPGAQTVQNLSFGAAQTPVWLEAMLAPVRWPAVNGRCASLPAGTRAEGAARCVRLVPYGMTSLRMTELPLLARPPGKNPRGQ